MEHNITNQDTYPISHVPVPKANVYHSNNMIYHGGTNNTTSIAMKIMKMYYIFIITNFLKMFNTFLLLFKAQLQQLVPSEDEQRNEQETAKATTSAIIKVINSEEFKKNWREFTTAMVSLLKELIEKVNNTVGDEGNEIIEKLIDMFSQNVTNIVKGVGMGVYTGFCAVPIVAPFCEGASIVMTGTQISATIFIKSLEVFEKMVSAFDKVFGDTAMPLANGVKQVIAFKNSIQHMISDKKNMDTTTIDSSIPNQLNTGNSISTIPMVNKTFSNRKQMNNNKTKKNRL